MAVPTDMDGFSEKIGSTDTYSRLALGDALLNFLGNNVNSIECSDIGQFIDKLVPWLTCSNFKVAQKGLEIMTALVERMKNDFKPYVPTVCPAVVDRLGDSHESVREKAQAVLMTLLEKEVLTPQQLFDRLGYSFSHKNSKVREEIMICLINTINLYGSNSIALSKLTPHLVKLLADQNIHVREQAFSTLIEMYRHVGDRLRSDIQKKYASTINPSRLAPLMTKMEELRDSGAVLPTSNTEGKYEDETDRQRSATKKLGSTKKPPVSHLSSTSLIPGAVDEEYFLNAFEDVPTVQIFSSHELKEMMNSIATTIGNQEIDWDRRVEAFKRIRSLIIAGAANFDDFNELLKKCELPFIESLKDLRSHVVRETCISLAYLAQTLGIKFGHVAEMVFPSLTALIQSSAKVIASAAFTAIRFIIQNVHHQRLLPIINQNLSSKSKEIRKAMCDVLDQLIHTWPLSILDRRIPLLQEAVRKGVSDADLDARISARRAYWAFKGYFPEQADALLQTLDYAYKRNLYGEASLSGSNQSLNQASNNRQTTSAARVVGRGPVTASSEKKIISPGNRSNSAIDLQAAQRANARAQYAALNRLKAGSGASLPRSRKSPEAASVMSPERTSRPRSRVSGYSQSQRKGIT